MTKVENLLKECEENIKKMKVHMPDLKKEMPTVVATHNTYTGRAIEHPINPFSIAARDIREEYENRYGK